LCSRDFNRRVLVLSRIVLGLGLRLEVSGKLISCYRLDNGEKLLIPLERHEWAEQLQAKAHQSDAKARQLEIEAQQLAE
jgi:hypothetical protein